MRTQTLAVRSASTTRGILNVNAMKVMRWTLSLRPARQKVSLNAQWWSVQQGVRLDRRETKMVFDVVHHLHISKRRFCVGYKLPSAESLKSFVVLLITRHSLRYCLASLTQHFTLSLCATVSDSSHLIIPYIPAPLLSLIRTCLQT